MPKNIVILLDGTSNEISANRTNVLRLYGALEKSEEQVVIYDPGVGTFGAENAWLRLWRRTVEIWGMATGWGLDQNVKDAYRLLVEHYDNGERPGADPVGRDRIYLFGFSRGAYSARVLAGFIRAVGLMRKDQLNLLDYAYRAYKRVDEQAPGETFAEVRLFERILDPDRPPIRLLGLFDTVASVIESGRYLPRLRSHAFTKTNTSVESVRHAVAIDERRAMFRPRLWPEGKPYHPNPFVAGQAVPQDVREVWFTGVHGDVGGGYPEAESGLAKLPLAWMIEETKPAGLLYKTRTINEVVLGKNPDKAYVAPDPFAEAHDSMTWGWKILEIIPRRRPSTSRHRGFLGWDLPLCERRAIPEGARVHRSVVERMARRGAPANLPGNYVIEEIGAPPGA